MIKGASRRMVVLKNTGSPLFEEAYFILREEAKEKSPRLDMISEANRIVAANALPRERTRRGEAVTRLLFFLLGALFGGGGAAVLFFLL